MARRTLLGVVAVGVVGVIFVAALVLFVGLFVLAKPKPLQGTSTTIRLETTGAVGQAIFWPRPNDPHPDWVGYLPTTILKVPANSTVHMQIFQDDSQSGLRNPFWSKVQGVEGGKIHMTYIDDQGNQQTGDFSSIDPATPAHTFAIPDLGVFVPLEGLPDSAPPGSYNTISFSFKVGKPGTFRWQCFVPCAAGYLYGNGGPMSTLGYMGGLLIVE